MPIKTQDLAKGRQSLPGDPNSQGLASVDDDQEYESDYEDPTSRDAKQTGKSETKKNSDEDDDDDYSDD